jgi:hypothetical protein
MSAIVNPNAGQLDSNQILQRGFDELTDRHRVDASVTVTAITAVVQVEIDAADGDNISLASADGTTPVTVTTVGAKNGLDVNIIKESSSVSVPVITNINIPLMATEQSFTFPSTTKRYSLKIRGSAQLKISYVASTSGTNYVTIPSGCEYIEEDIVLTANLPIYFQCNKAGQILEIIAWN